MTRPVRALDTAAVRDLTLDTEPWLSCEDCFTLMDVYVETVLADPHTTAMPQLRVHLAGCPACAEEAESLRALVAAETTDSPTG